MPWGKPQHSQALGMDYAVHTDGRVMVNDGNKTTYTPSEIKALNRLGIEITPQIHMVKKVFSGEILLDSEA